MLLRHRRVVLAVFAVLGLVAGSAHAALQTLDGQYLQVSYDDALLPAGFGQVQLRESALNWACSDVSCSLTGPLSAAVVFSAANGQPVSVTSQALNFNLSVLPKTVDNIVDPLGNSWGIVSADLGKWAIGVDIASQGKPAGDAQFATAYGQFSYTARRTGVVPTWSVNTPVAVAGKIKETAVLGLTQAGAVSVGPGASGVSTLDESGRVYGSDGDFPWVFSTQLDGARWAYPSTTEVLCSSLSCMEFKTGNVNVNNYFLSFDLIGTPTAVPEAGTMSMMLLGGLGLIGVTRRRRVSAAA
ncbi:PEP-CTERM sorting domain-containing protein [Aquabacterium sp.]|uniref:PEP-CTERM sorting domain-containing protein n=1 Tax=Aquabacterium sp. TaxID=1872578 RepID=UPI0040382896